MAHDKDYVELGISCAQVCQALDWGLEGRDLYEINQHALQAIEDLIS